MSAIHEHPTNSGSIQSPERTSPHSVPLHQRDQAALVLLSQSSKLLKQAANRNTSSSESNNPILEALLEEIQTDSTIDRLTKESLSSVLNSVGGEIQALQDLQNQIQDLEQKLKASLTPAEAAKIESQIKELQEEYDNALYEQQEAEKDKATKEQANKDLRRENEALAKEAAAAKDPKVKKQLEQQIAANRQKIQQNKMSVAEDNSTISQTNATIQHVEELAQALQARYPSLKSFIGPLLEGMVKHQDVDNRFKQLVNHLAKIPHQDAVIASQIDELRGELSLVEAEIQEKVSKTDQTAQGLERLEQSGLAYNHLIITLERFLGQLTELKSLNKVDEHFQKREADITDHLAKIQFERKRGLA